MCSAERYELDAATRVKVLADDAPVGVDRRAVHCGGVRSHVAPRGPPVGSDGDAEERLERQRRAVRLNSWVDRATGMGRWSAYLGSADDAVVGEPSRRPSRSLVPRHPPGGCPVDLLEKQACLRCACSPCWTVVGCGWVDQKSSSSSITPPQPDGTPTIDWGLPVELPDRVLETLNKTAAAHRGGPQRGDHRRPRRTEPRPHDEVGQPCPTSCARCRLCLLCDPRVLCALHAHQVAPRHLLGRRRIDRSRQFAAVMSAASRQDPPRRLALRLTPQRTLTITLPDGTIMTTGPPKRNAA